MVEPGAAAGRGRANAAVKVATGSTTVAIGVGVVMADATVRFEVEVLISRAAAATRRRIVGCTIPADRRRGAGRPLTHAPTSRMVDAATCAHASQPTTAIALTRVESGSSARPRAS